MLKQITEKISLIRQRKQKQKGTFCVVLEIEGKEISRAIFRLGNRG